MKNYKLLIINGSSALRAIFIGCLRQGNKAMRKIFFLSPEALTHVRRTQIPLIVYRLALIINNFLPLAIGDKEGVNNGTF